MSGSSIRDDVGFMRLATLRPLPLGHLGSPEGQSTSGGLVEGTPQLL
jgi:hypothetical protein